MGNPSAQDYQRLSQKLSDLTRAINGMADSLRAANTNLVAIHAQLKEMNEKDE